MLNNIAIKVPKTKYTDEELAPGIRRYIFEYIQNLDKGFADLEQVGVTIARAKSLFCGVDLKIIRYICDAIGRHFNNSNIFKNH